MSLPRAVTGRRSAFESPPPACASTPMVALASWSWCLRRERQYSNSAAEPQAMAQKRAGCEAKEIEIASRGADSQSAAPALVPAPPKAHGTRGRGAYPRARRGACKNNRIRKVAMPWKSRCRIFLARENRRAVFGRFREANIARSLTVWADCRRNSFVRESRPRYTAPVMARKGHRR